MCKAQMSMKSDSLLCHRRSGVTCLCDLRPCLAGHKKMLLHHSPYLPTCKTKANERAFAAEEPRHTPGIIPFSVCPIIRCPANTLHGAATLVKQASVKGLLRFS